MTDQTAAARPVPTFADRTATDAPLPTWLPDALEELRAERVKTGRLEGDLRSLAQAVREALAERDEAARICGEAGIEIDRLRAERDQARQTADFRQGVIDRHRQELGAAGDVLAVVRDAVERIDRALATYDTTPGEEATVNLGQHRRLRREAPNGCDHCSVEPGESHRYPGCPGATPPSSVPSRRAQEEPDLAPVIAHQWSVRYPDGFVDGGRFTEAGARQRATELGGEVVWRPVGQWDPA